MRDSSSEQQLGAVGASPFEAGGEAGLSPALAHRFVGRDLYAVDLGAVVSKYIGETEMNFDRLFERAAESGAVLVIDEADALFGKRTQVRDAHDRYANVEIDYLLQRMEAFGGVLILTSNKRSHIDPALLRRLRFIVEFPLPTAAGGRLSELSVRCREGSGNLDPFRP